MRYELFQSFQVLCIKLYVIVPSPFHPEGLHCSGTPLVHRQPMGEVDDLILRTVNDQHGGGDLGDLVDTARQKGRERALLVKLMYLRMLGSRFTGKDVNTVEL